MKEYKFFDRYQLLITIIGIGSFATSLLFLVPMVLFATVEYDEVGNFSKLIYNPFLQALYTIFMVINFMAVLWFIVRAITFKMRKKEYDLEQ